jgi:hypothetical protein
MVARESICLRRLAGGRRGGIVGFSRFLANPRVTVESLVEGWGAEIAEACAGRHVLAIQDTSGIVAWAKSAKVSGVACCCTRCWGWTPRPAAFWG